jgi:hypothetical protein
MSQMSRATLALACVVCMGCYHATVETGASPSPEVIYKSFASGWIYGLVPPSTVATAARCPNGVAKVETQLSFVNQLVSFLTLGIYTPMQITVTCAVAPKTAAIIPVPDHSTQQAPAPPSPSSVTPPPQTSAAAPPVTATGGGRSDTELQAFEGIRRAVDDLQRRALLAGYHESEPGT